MCQRTNECRINRLPPISFLLARCRLPWLVHPPPALPLLVQPLLAHSRARCWQLVAHGGLASTLWPRLRNRPAYGVRLNYSLAHPPGTAAALPRATSPGPWQGSVPPGLGGSTWWACTWLHLYPCACDIGTSTLVDPETRSASTQLALHADKQDSGPWCPRLAAPPSVPPPALDLILYPSAGLNTLSRSPTANHYKHQGLPCLAA